MTYTELSNSPLLYILVSVGLALIFLMCVYFYRQGKKRALELGISSEKIKEIQKSTITVTLIPSLSIVVAMVTLSAAVGTPWAWFRLSVVGSLVYELLAAQMASAAMGFSSLSEAAALDGSVFGTVMIVMSIGIIAGVFINALFGKQIIMGSARLGKVGGGFGDIINSSFMVALMAVFLPVQIAQNGAVAAAVILTSIVATLLFHVIIEKTGWTWLGNFSLAIVLIVGMISSLLWTNLLG